MTATHHPSKSVLKNFISDVPETLKDYYAILELEKNATQQEVREAYFRMKSTYCSNNAALYSLMQEGDISSSLATISEAYNVLADKNSRMRYDRLLLAKGLASKESLSQEIHTGFNAFNPEFNNVHTLNRSSPHGRSGSTPRDPKLSVKKLVADKGREQGIQDKLLRILEEEEEINGELLRRLRQTVGVSQEEMQENIKVCIGYIEDMESNNFERLPQPVYVKGFLKNYLRFLGVKDSERIVQAYARKMQEWCEKEARA